MVPIRKKLVGCDCDNLVLVFKVIEMAGFLLGFVVVAGFCLFVPYLTRIDCSVSIAVVNTCWLLETREVVDGNCRTINRSDIIIDNLSVAVIVGSAHVVEKKLTVFDV